ncbi:MAG TPA: hypothetical protein VNH11_07710 [Pirellulales bacterium]|nr:hypothetical protein [Pirellulales bacterium]
MFPIDCVFDRLAEGDNIDDISTRFNVKRSDISTILHGIARLLRSPRGLKSAEPTQQVEGDATRQERSRQQEIDDLRAEHQEEFDRIEEIMPELDELLSLSVEPPRELLDGPSS